MYKVKIKPVYNFQSIEVEFEVEDFEEAIDLVDERYSELLDVLIASTDEVLSSPQPQQKGQKQVAKVKEELATEKQKQMLKKYNIPFDESTTKSEAFALIKKSYEDSIKNLE